jgi:hypothetical protein
LAASAAVLILSVPCPVRAYSVLAHEAAIDASWNEAIQPLLKRRFPRATEDDLQRARSFAYGGSVIQDLGYYPFGSRFFSNLLHYTRSGDFVEALIRDAQTIDEFAFALGALAHYANDNTGHPEAVNRAVPLIYPKLKAKFGDRVTYVQAPKQHVIVEFSFDVVQTAAGRYLPDSFQRFIGFRVATELLDRAFRETYGLTLDEVFADKDRSIATYRYAVSQIVPSLTEAAWRDKQEEIARLAPGIDRSHFVFAYRRADFERDYGNDYEKPKFFARLLGVIYRIVPKIGPLKPLSFKAPTPEAEAMFAESFADATRRFRAALADLPDRRFQFRNTNFDTGQPVTRGQYALADETYDELLERWRSKKFAGLPRAMRTDLLAFYRGVPAERVRVKVSRERSEAILALERTRD